MLLKNIIMNGSDKSIISSMVYFSTIILSVMMIMYIGTLIMAHW
jgi:hypothetical protein